MENPIDQLNIRKLLNELIDFESTDQLIPFIGLVDGNAITNGVSGTRLLHYAANGVVNDPLVLARFLIEEMGANPNLTNRAGDTPLHSAAQFSSQINLFEYLVSVSNVNAKNAQGKTPIITAILSGNMSGILALANKGADIDTITFEGKSVGHFMEYMYKKEGVSTLELIYLARAAKSVSIEEIDGRKIADIGGYVIDLSDIVQIKAPVTRRRL